MCSILKCSLEIALKLKEIGFPQQSLCLSNTHYVLGDLIYNKKLYKLGDYIYDLEYIEDENKDKLIFIPYYAEIIDWFEVEKNLSLSIWNDGKGYKYSIYDMNEDEDSYFSYTGNDIDSPITINEVCINKAIDIYLDLKECYKEEVSETEPLNP